MSKWISFQELLDRLGIIKFEIFEYLKKGLQPYSKDSGKPLYCPRFYHMGPHLEDRIKNIKYLSSPKYDPPSDELKKYYLELITSMESELKEIKKDDPEYRSWKWFDDEMWLQDEDIFEGLYDASYDDCLKQLYSDLEKAVFRKDDIDHELGKSDKNIKNEIETTEKNKENLFKRKGEYWFIKYNGKFTTLHDYEKIRYIVHLLDNPNIELHSSDLVNTVKKENIDKKIKEQSDAIKSAEFERKEWESIPEEELSKRGVSLTDLSIDGLTKEDKDKLEDQIYDICENLKIAEKRSDQKSIERHQKELNRFKNYMLNEYGVKTYISQKGVHFKQLHRPGPEVEKARKNVTNQIKNAIKDIEKEIPYLAEHLRSHIETGKKCIYRPDYSKPINWHIIW